MPKSDSESKPKKGRWLRPTLFGILAFVLILAGMVLNSVRECLWSYAFPPAWRIAFNNGMKRARVNRPDGIKMMEAALQDCEKSNSGDDEKAKVFYDYGAWNFNQQDLKDHFAIAKRAYSRCQELTHILDRKAMALEMMANSDCFAGVVGDAEKNAEQGLKYKKDDGITNPAALWGAYVAIGRAAMAAGHYEKAELAFKNALQQAEAGKLNDGSNAAQSTADLACAYCLEGKRDLADKAFFDAIQEYDQMDGACNEASERVIAQYARALRQSGDNQSAEKLAARLDDPESLESIGPFFQAYFL